VPALRARRLWANPRLAEPRRTILAPPVGLLFDHDPRARRKRSRSSPAASYSSRATFARCLPRAKNAPGLDGAAHAPAPGSVGIWSRGLNQLEVRGGTCARSSPCAVLTAPSIVRCRARCGLTDSLACDVRPRWPRGSARSIGGRSGAAALAQGTSPWGCVIWVTRRATAAWHVGAGYSSLLRRVATFAPQRS
jgi:hypothetical protein